MTISSSVFNIVATAALIIFITILCLGSRHHMAWDADANGIPQEDLTAYLRWRNGYHWTRGDRALTGSESPPSPRRLHSLMNSNLEPRTQSKPRIQYDFPLPDLEAERRRRAQMHDVQDSIARAWETLNANSAPQAVVESMLLDRMADLLEWLDVLWLAGRDSDFRVLVRTVADADLAKLARQSYGEPEDIVRCLAALLSAYDLSREAVLLRKAVQVGDELYIILDQAQQQHLGLFEEEGLGESADAAVALQLGSELNSLPLAMAQLTQATGNTMYIDILADEGNDRETPINDEEVDDVVELRRRQTRQQQESRRAKVRAQVLARAASIVNATRVEKLQQPLVQKQQVDRPVDSADNFEKVFRPLTVKDLNILLPRSDERFNYGDFTPPDACVEHRACSLAGELAQRARLSGRAQDLSTAKRLVQGCLWAAQQDPLGLIPETFCAVPCVPHMQFRSVGEDGTRSKGCPWDPKAWRAAVEYRLRVSPNSGNNHVLPADYSSHEAERDQGPVAVQRQPHPVPPRHSAIPKLAPGISGVPDSRHLLRPEAIASIFVLYRFTADAYLLDRAWGLFQAAERHARTQRGLAASPPSRPVIVGGGAARPATIGGQDVPVAEVPATPWTPAALKYFFLLYAPPSICSLDHYLFTPQGHLLRRVVDLPGTIQSRS